jgi:hypothetical protein
MGKWGWQVEIWRVKSAVAGMNSMTGSGCKELNTLL